MTSHQLPGLAVLDHEARAVWIYRGRALGDYPPIKRVLAELDRLLPGTTAGRTSTADPGLRRS